jgi:hypothetical protein
MSEGHKALFRVALTLLKSWTAALQDCEGSAGVASLLCPPNPLAARAPVNMAALLEAAFKMHHLHVIRLSSGIPPDSTEIPLHV